MTDLPNVSAADSAFRRHTRLREAEWLLLAVLIAYGTLMLSERTIAMHRLVICECDQFPEVATAFYQAAIQRANEGMAAWLRRQCLRGLIKLDDPDLAAGMLRGMMAMDPQRAVMLGQRDVPDADEIAARAKQCERLFLDGCLVR